MGFFLPFKSFMIKCCYEHSCKEFCGHMFSFLLYIYLVVELVGHMVTLISILRTCETIFQSSCTILQSSQQCMRVPIFPHSCQYLLSVLYSHPSWYVVVSYCDLMTDIVEHFFMNVLAFMYLWRAIYSEYLVIFSCVVCLIIEL